MQFKSISLRIYFWLLVFSLLPLIIMSELFIFAFDKQLQQSEFNYLNSISDKKMEQIDTYFKERNSDINILAKNPIIANSMDDFGAIFDKNEINSKAYLQADIKLRDYSENYLKRGYYDLFLISPEGDIVFTVIHEADFATNLNEGPYSNSGLADAYRGAQAELKVKNSTFDYYPPSSESAAFLATPIMRGEKLLGVLALQINSDRVFAVVIDNLGLGKTGETVVAQESNNAMNFIGPLKFNGPAEGNLKISKANSLARPMQKALNNERGYGRSVDYRGVEVIAVWRYLPVLKWGIVIKKDTAEAFSSVQKMREMRWIVLASIIIAILVAASFIGRSIVQPTKDLINAAKEIAAGNLNKRVLVASQDEVGQLAVSFNHMTEVLQNTHVDLEGKIKEAERANLAKSEFLSHMSHELRTPMNAILGFAQMLEMDVDDFDEIQRENINEILIAGRHLLGLINGVLDLARIESGKLEISMEEVLLSDVLEQSITMITSQAEVKNITLIDVLSDEGYVVHADFTRLKQVIINLLTNAVKYNREDGAILLDGGITDEGYLRVNVKDTGCGLKKEDVDKLFKPFERLNPVDNVEGTGIGLTITKHLIELMEGHIGVKSVLDEGSVFWIEIALFKNE